MKNSVDIVLKSGSNVIVENFKYISYYSSDGDTKITKFDNFYLYDKLLTFVGETTIVTINSQDILYVKFSGNFNE